MSDAGLAPEPMVFPLRGGRGSISLHASGFRHPGAPFTREGFTAYADLTHWIAGSRALRFGTRQGIFTIPRSWFSDASQADEWDLQHRGVHQAVGLGGLVRSQCFQGA